MPQISPAAILPYGFLFSVEILGNPLVNFTGIEAGFQEVSGINASMKFDSITEGGENRFVHKVPARTSFDSNLELKRGLIVASSPFGDWCRTHLSSGLNAMGPGKKIKTEDIIVHLLNSYQVPLMSWQFVRAYPVKWEVNGLNAKQSEIAAESISLAYQYFTKV
jgi:phage tail-like protein